MKLRAVVAGCLVMAVLSLSVGLSKSAEAATTRTWTGNGASNNWTDAGNWNTGAPVAGDTLVFPITANRKTNTNNFASNTSFAEIQLRGPGYTLGGNAVSITAELLQDSTGTNTVNLNLNGPGGIELNEGKLILGGNNGFSGGVSIADGVILALTNTALGNTASETAVDENATLQVSGGVDLPEDVYLDGEAPEAGFDGNGQLQSLSGTNSIARVFIEGEVVIGVGNSVLTITELRSITGGSFTLIGGGKLIVESSFFTGIVNVENGNFTWNASSQIFVNVADQGLFRGLGTASSADVYGGTVWPGSANMPGVLDIFGATNFHSGYFRVDIDGPLAGFGYGQLKTSGLQLNSLATVLELDVSVVPSTGDVYRIIDNVSGSAVSGTFLDLPEGALFTDSGYVWKISYKGGTGNDVTLTVVRPASADLHLQMTALPSPVGAGQNIVYTVTVTNEGPDKASSPTVSLGTPVGTSYVGSTQPANWACSIPAPGPTVSCSGPALAAGDTVTLTLTFKVLPGSAVAVAATAGVSSTTNDPFSADNSATLSTPIGTPDPRPFKRYVIMVARD